MQNMQSGVRDPTGPVTEPCMQGCRGVSSRVQFIVCEMAVAGDGSGLRGLLISYLCRALVAGVGSCLARPGNYQHKVAEEQGMILSPLCGTECACPAGPESAVYPRLQRHWVSHWA